MGNSQFSVPPDANDVLVQSFQLDADADYLSLPICYPGKQAMFHVPRNFSTHLSTFIPYTEGVKMIEEINQILLKTAFPNKQCNPLFILCILIGFACIGPGVGAMSSGYTSGIGFMMIGIFLPYVFYFALMLYKKSERKRSLLAFVQEWNEKKGNGVYIALGGGGNVRGVAVGSETGGTYENFYMATWDPKSLLVRGYLHIFVNYQERANWCQNNGVPFVAPVPVHQQTMEQQIAPQEQFSAPPAAYQAPAPPPGYQAPAPPAGYQVPAGFALVPIPNQPPPEFQVPAGYALVPQSQDVPPSYSQANKM